MIRSFSFLSGIIFLISCEQKQQDQQNSTGADSSVVDSVAVLNDPKNNLNIQTNSFSEIDSSGILMFPLSMGESARSGGSYSYKEMPGNSYWNIVFLNSKTNEHNLLSEKKMLIRSFEYKYASNSNAEAVQTNRYIFYTVTSDDLNKDRKLDDEDPEYLFCSDKEGKNFQQVSPANFDLQTWQFIKSANKVVLTARKDSDKNNRFDDNDEVTTFAVDIETGLSPVEPFATDFKNKLKILYDRDWKRLKK